MKMETQKEQIKMDEEIIELIKSHLYENLDILNRIEVKKHKTFVCENCKKTFNQKIRRRKKEKEYCYNCYVELGLMGKRIWNMQVENPLDISNMKEEKIPKLILNHIKQPIIVSQPITDNNMVGNLNESQNSGDEEN